MDSDSQVDESVLPSGQQESRFETEVDCVSPVTVGTNLPVEGDDSLLGEFCFDEDVFVSSKGNRGPSKSRSEKRKDRLSYARGQKATGTWN